VGGYWDNDRMRSVELFAGGGGLLLGTHLAGFPPSLWLSGTRGAAKLFG